MPYILVRSAINATGTVFDNSTCIDCHAEDEATTLQGGIESELQAERLQKKRAEATLPYKTKKPPHEVLNFLESHGYKVVGINTVGVTFMWTIHKQTESLKTTDQSQKTDAT